MIDQLSILIMTVLMMFATFLTRGFPFWFLKRKQDAPTLLFMGDVLPLMIMPLLVIYALKDISLFSTPYGVPEASAAVLIILVHLWRRNAFLSIVMGTALYVYFQSLSL